MTIYVVTQGEYSDYGIKAVFTDKEQAIYYAALHNDDYYEPCMLEEYEADEVKIDTSKDMADKWTARFSHDRHIEKIWQCDGDYFDSPPNIEDYPWKGGKTYIDVFVPVGTSEDKVRKIMCDALAKWTYEQMEVIQ